MDTSLFDSIAGVLLGWAQPLTDRVYQFINSGGAPQSTAESGATTWFLNNWLMLVLALIVAGVVVDRVVWLLRWQPYKVWRTKMRAMTRRSGRRPARKPAPKRVNSVAKDA